MKTEVYSWRVSAELKSDLERAARRRRLPVSTVLDAAVRDWLKRSADASEDEEQRRLHEAAASCVGSIAGRNPLRAETAKKAVKEILRQKRAR